MSDLAFFLLAAVVLAGAAATVLARNLVRAAYGLAATLLGTAGIYLLLSAPVLAAVQILLYTGGVLTLVVFAIVLSGSATPAAPWRRPLPAAIAALALFLALAPHALRVGETPGAGGPEVAERAGSILFTTYVLPFELLSVLLLGALFGALAIARREGRA